MTLTSSGALLNGQLSVTSAATRCPAGISDDGRYVAFMTTATNLLANDANGSLETVFVRDTQKNTTTLVDTDQNGTQHASGNSVCPQVSGDGRYIAFASNVQQLVTPDTENYDTYVRANPIPTVANASPTTAGRGTSVTITVNGTYFLPGVAGHFIGDGITVTNTSRVSETQVKFTISVAANATVGERTVIVYNLGTGAGTLSGATTQFSLNVT